MLVWNLARLSCSAARATEIIRTLREHGVEQMSNVWEAALVMARRACWPPAADWMRPSRTMHSLGWAALAQLSIGQMRNSIILAAALARAPAYAMVRTAMNGIAVLSQAGGSAMAVPHCVAAL